MQNRLDSTNNWLNEPGIRGRPLSFRRFNSSNMGVYPEKVTLLPHTRSGGVLSFRNHAERVNPLGEWELSDEGVLSILFKPSRTETNYEEYVLLDHSDVWLCIQSSTVEDGTVFLTPWIQQTAFVETTHRTFASYLRAFRRNAVSYITDAINRRFS